MHFGEKFIFIQSTEFWFAGTQSQIHEGPNRRMILSDASFVSIILDH